METDKVLNKYKNLLDRKKSLESKAVELRTSYRYHKGEYDKAMKKLKEEYKVDSMEEGFSLRDRLDKELTEKLRKLEKDLSSIEDAIGGEEDGLSEPEDESSIS